MSIRVQSNKYKKTLRFAEEICVYLSFSCRPLSTKMFRPMSAHILFKAIYIHCSVVSFKVCCLSFTNSLVRFVCSQDKLYIKYKDKHQLLQIFQTDYDKLGGQVVLLSPKRFYWWNSWHWINEELWQSKVAYLDFYKSKERLELLR